MVHCQNGGRSQTREGLKEGGVYLPVGFPKATHVHWLVLRAGQKRGRGLLYVSATTAHTAGGNRESISDTHTHSRLERTYTCLLRQGEESCLTPSHMTRMDKHVTPEKTVRTAETHEHLTTPPSLNINTNTGMDGWMDG